jgi:hypothetical protein
MLGKADTSNITSFAHLVTVNDYSQLFCILSLWNILLTLSSQAAAHRYVGHSAGTASDQGEDHADQVRTERCVLYSADAIPDYHRVQHEWKEYLHTISGFDGHHGADRQLVSTRRYLRQLVY